MLYNVLMKRLLFASALPLLLGCCCPISIPADTKPDVQTRNEEAKYLASEADKLLQDKEKARQVFGIDPNAQNPYWPLAYAKGEHVRNGSTSDMTGFIMNCSDKRTGMIVVSFDMYDNAGNKVGTASDMIDSIGPWESWKFKAVYFGNDATYNRGPIIKR